MFRALVRLALAASLVIAGFGAAGAALADTDCDSTCENTQEGDNSGATEQGGASASGDSVDGQVVGAVSAGDAKIDAKNVSEDTGSGSGGAFGFNEAANFVGLNSSSTTTVRADDATAGNATNIQDGDNELALTQTADATSGDGVGGQVIGVVTTVGGSADIVASNEGDADGGSGDATAENEHGAFTGLNTTDPGETEILAFDASADTAVNLQDGDNTNKEEQATLAATGDGVGGQVIGVVSSGDASVDAKNEGGSGGSGDASAINDSAGFVGLNSSSDTAIVADASAGFAENVQEGDNDLDEAQTADAASGDGVGGQVIGVVTTAGGSADVVADSVGDDGGSGSATAENFSGSFTGLNSSDPGAFFVDASVGTARNVQDGDNATSGEQTATAATGDGVGGQVLGVVSAGEATLDAKNVSDGSGGSGDATASNFSSTFAGLNSATATFVSAGDVSAEFAANQQDGDNTIAYEQLANASSGDATTGQVAGVVTSAGGSADVVLDNEDDSSASSGSALFQNTQGLFVGLNVNTDTLSVAPLF